MKQFLVITFVLFTSIAWNQEPKIDKLEMLYSQGHYKRVLRKSKRLLDKPYYDYSAMPDLYAGLSLFQLTKESQFRKKNPKAMDRAEDYFQDFLTEDVQGRAYQMHIHEITELKYYLARQSLDYEKKGKTDKVEYYNAMIERLFKDSKTPQIISTERPEIENPDKASKKDQEKSRFSQRDKIIKYAEKFLGTPYKYGSAQPDNGFDCSGYTSYVLKKYDYYIPRSSKNQHQKIDKIKRKNVKKGDLVFFGNPSIHHVGIVYDVLENNEIKMIHASSSLGISIVNVDQSSYWKQRLKSFGRVIRGK